MSKPNLELLKMILEIVTDDDFELTQEGCKCPVFYICPQCKVIRDWPIFISSIESWSPYHPTNTASVHFTGSNKIIQGHIVCKKCFTSLVCQSIDINVIPDLTKNIKNNNAFESTFIDWLHSPPGKNKKILREKMQKQVKTFEQYIKILDRADKTGELSKWCINGALKKIYLKSIEIKAGFVWLIRNSRHIYSDQEIFDKVSQIIKDIRQKKINKLRRSLKSIPIEEQRQLVKTILKRTISNNQSIIYCSTDHSKTKEFTEENIEAICDKVIQGEKVTFGINDDFFIQIIEIDNTFCIVIKHCQEDIIN
jgi:hypothetical protein